MFQTVKRLLAPDWAQKMRCISVPNRRTAFTNLSSYKKERVIKLFVFFNGWQNVVVWRTTQWNLCKISLYQKWILSPERAKWVFSNFNKRTRYLGKLITECFITAEDVSAFGQHRKFPPHARKTSGTQGTKSQFLVDIYRQSLFKAETIISSQCLLPYF